jgi:hypothetical protein
MDRETKAELKEKLDELLEQTKAELIKPED